MPEAENVASVRRFVDAFNHLDLESVVADIEDDAELHEWPEAPGAQSYRGAEGVRAALDTWFDTWEWMRVEIEDIFDVGEHVLVALHQRIGLRARNQRPRPFNSPRSYATATAAARSLTPSFA